MQNRQLLGPDISWRVFEQTALPEEDLVVLVYLSADRRRDHGETRAKRAGGVPPVRLVCPRCVLDPRRHHWSRGGRPLSSESGDEVVHHNGIEPVYRQKALPQLYSFLSADPNALLIQLAVAENEFPGFASDQMVSA
jgi:hypothetical protein